MSTVRILADRIFDGVSFSSEPRRIEIEGERIARIVPANVPAPGDIDARGETVLPGLVNAHVHIARGGMFEPLEPLSISQVVTNLRLTLAAGVTTVGDMGCAPGLAGALASLVRDDPLAGPSIVAAGPILTAPRGYPLDWLPAFYQRAGVALACANEDEARRAVERVARAGMSHVKLAVMHRSYSDRPLAALEARVARAAVAEAHASGLKAFAHAHSVQDYGVALAAGVDALMHSSFEPLDAELVDRVRDSGVTVCPTLWVFDSVCLGAEAAWDRDSRRTGGVTRAVVRSWRRFREAYETSGDVLPAGIAGGLPKARAREGVRFAAANLVLLRDAGVPIAYGDDAAYGFCVHGRPFEELDAMRRTGMSVEACLRAATSGSAALLGLGDRGRIAAGHGADILVVDGDLERDLGALERVRHVLVRGRRLDGGLFERSARAARAGVAVARGMAATAVAMLRA
ncbi:MAG: amidohydrolase family protein [Deltaproteobacteria bacterium]|nr:amidohydrolase family protein [Deltaproteobacteria bacterium]